MKKEYNNLSGGEKTIVNLATILLKNPSILLLDEPTNGLDIKSKMWLEEFLINFKNTVLEVLHSLGISKIRFIPSSLAFLNAS